MFEGAVFFSVTNAPVDALCEELFWGDLWILLGGEPLFEAELIPFWLLVVPFSLFVLSGSDILESS